MRVEIVEDGSVTNDGLVKDPLSVVPVAGQRQDKGGQVAFR